MRAEEATHVITLVSSENHALQRQVAARIAEDVSVSMPVPTGDAVTAEQIENGVGVKLPAHQDPHVDAVTAHSGPEVELHLLLFDLPFPESTLQSRALLLAVGGGHHDGWTRFGGGVLRGCELRPASRGGCERRSDPEKSVLGHW